jgi:hypothetical protein
LAEEQASRANLSLLVIDECFVYVKQYHHLQYDTRNQAARGGITFPLHPPLVTYRTQRINSKRSGSSGLLC